MTTPFFRGFNYADWLVALLLQSAADFGDSSSVETVAGIMGPSTVRRYLAETVFFPDLYLCYTADYVFIISASTQGRMQWIGNVLGSTADTTEFVTGDVSTYFGLAATFQFVALSADLRANKGTRQIVLIGFSLGAASMTILKEILKQALNFDSACFAFASPRAGADGFAENYPVDNFQGLTAFFDPVPNVPPRVWTRNGIFSGYKPISPFAHYANPLPNYSFDTDFTIHVGFFDMDLIDVFRSVYSGDVFTYHNQPYYAKALRSHLPDFMPPGYEGFLNAQIIDPLALQVLSPVPSWPWPKGLDHFFTPGGGGMGSQIGILMRDNARQLGYEEVYYSTTAASAALLASVVSTLLPARAKMLASYKTSAARDGMEIYYARVSNVGSPRQSFGYRPPVPILGTYPYGQGMATIEDCYIYNGYDASNLFKRQCHFRGVDSITLDDEQAFPGGALDTLIQGASPWSLLSVLKLLGCAIHSTRATPAVNYQVTGATQAAQGTLITLAVTNPAGFVPGTLWDLRGVRAAPLLNGRWQAAGPQIANQIVLSGSQRYTAPLIVTGTLYAVGPNYLPLDHLALLGGGTKKTGRPPSSRRGRRSTQLRRR